MANTNDKFLRKMEFYEKNTEIISINPDLSTIDLFKDSSYGGNSEQKLITFGQLERIDQNASDNWDAAIVQFWTKDSEGKSIVGKSIYIPKALSIPINKEKNLHQVLF